MRFHHFVTVYFRKFIAKCGKQFICVAVFFEVFPRTFQNDSIFALKWGGGGNETSLLPPTKIEMFDTDR